MTKKRRTCKSCIFYEKQVSGKGKTKVVDETCNVNPPEIMGVYHGVDHGTGIPQFSTLGLARPVTNENRTACEKYSDA